MATLREPPGRRRREVGEGDGLEARDLLETGRALVAQGLHGCFEARRVLSCLPRSRLPRQRWIASRRRGNLAILVLAQPPTDVSRVTDVVAVIGVEDIDVKAPIGDGGVATILVATEVFGLVVASTSTHTGGAFCQAVPCLALPRASDGETR